MARKLRPVSTLASPRSPSSAGTRRGAGVAEGGQDITAQILRLIQERQLAPGDRLPSERVLAQRLAVSRPALRESLATLEAMRLIARRANSGIYLADRDSPPSFESVVLRSSLGLPLETETIVQSMEVRNLLELHAVDLACKRRSAADIAHIQAIVERTRLRLAERRSIIDLDEAFHLGVVAAAHNPIFLQIVHAFYRLSKPRRDVYFAEMKRCSRSHREHQIILKAIEARDSRAARAAMYRHIHEGFWSSVLKQRAPHDLIRIKLPTFAA